MFSSVPVCSSPALYRSFLVNIVKIVISLIRFHFRDDINEGHDRDDSRRGVDMMNCAKFTDCIYTSAIIRELFIYIFFSLDWFN